MKKLLSRITFTVSALLVVGCTTPPAYEALTLEDITIQQIEAAIAAGEAIPAMQDLSALSRVRDIPPERVDSIFTEAEVSLSEQLTHAYETGDFLTAYALARSLEFLNSEQDTDGLGSLQVLQALALSLENEGHILPSLLLRRRAADLSEDRSQLLADIANDAQTHGYSSFGHLARETAATTHTEQLFRPEVDKQRMIASTVTIWVNRGIKIERGIGYPDRVIGSGFFIDRDGYLITNYHVIESEVDPEYEGFSRLYVRPANDDTVKIPATVIGWDRVFDLALLKVDIEPEYVFSPALEDANKPGDRIYAIGSPAGLTNTITSGIISATGRRFFQIGDAMQVDVPINPGNSGGPLVDDSGDLVGVVFAGIEQFEGINFAIPARWINASIPRMFLGGEATYPWIGAVVEEIQKGLEVVYVLPGAPAQRAGISAGDVIISMGANATSTIEASQAALIDLVPGTLIPVEWLHEGTRVRGSVALATRPYMPMELAYKRDIPIHLVPPLFGAFLEVTSRSILGNTYVITRILPGSIADEAGLSVMDPVKIQSLEFDEENSIAFLQIIVQKRKVGFIERAVQIGAYLEIDTFL